MKINLAIFAVLFAVLLTSCSNDEIPINRSVTFKLNPSTVVENLYELSAGDLTSLSSGATLNVDLYVYDKSGKLAYKDNQGFNAYTHIMTSNSNLENGEYTIVAISHVSSSVDFWGFEGVDNINTLKVTDNGYIGGKSKILGLTVETVNVTDGENTFNIDIKNAGAVACVAIVNWNRYSNVKSFGLAGKQSCDYITTNSYGNVEYSLESKSDYGFYKVKFDYNSNQTGAMSYFFTFPIKNAAMKFFAETTSGSTNYLGANLVDDINLGDSYLIVYDVTSEETEWVDMTPSRSSRSANKFIEMIREKTPHPVFNYEEGTITIE